MGIKLYELLIRATLTSNVHGRRRPIDMSRYTQKGVNLTLKSTRITQDHRGPKGYMVDKDFFIQLYLMGVLRVIA